MKFCKDCFYYEKPVVATENPEKYSRCTAFNTISPVTGRVNEIIEFCDLMRGVLGKCGAEAKLYQELEPRELYQRDEPQGATNWDTDWNATYANENGVM